MSISIPDASQSVRRLPPSFNVDGYADAVTVEPTIGLIDLPAGRAEGPAWSGPLGVREMSGLRPAGQDPTWFSGRTRFPEPDSVSVWYSQFPQIAQSGLPV